MSVIGKKTLKQLWVGCSFLKRQQTASFQKILTHLKIILYKIASTKTWNMRSEREIIPIMEFINFVFVLKSIYTLFLFTWTCCKSASDFWLSCCLILANCTFINTNIYELCCQKILSKPAFKFVGFIHCIACDLYDFCAW